MTDHWEIEAFYDGACPLCTREVAFVRRRDRERRIRFTDFTADGFDPAAIGVTREALMARMHGRLPDGTLVAGVEVFRRMYAAIGWSRLVAISRWPVVRTLCDRIYALFARHRLRITGRCATDGECRTDSG